MKFQKSFYEKGARHFRIGKQSCFYRVPDNIELLKEIRERFPEIKTLHIDNVNPVNVVRDEKENN
jgi:radical SAM superfamily enzyme with C-terminal helix-hairpin-helix motif